MNVEIKRLHNLAVETANNGYLCYLSQHLNKFTKEDYQIFYSNMLAWLEPTKNRLEAGLDILINERDTSLESVIAAFEHNIYDEAGLGCENKSHAELFNKSCHTYCKQIYNSNLVNFKPTFETLHLRNTSLLLFSNNMYEMLGACYAQEVHALPQLQRMFEGHQLNQGKCHEVWENINQFYNVHLDGTEARHVEELQQIFSKILNNKSRAEMFRYGFITMICLLTQFWKSLEVRTT